MPEPHARLTALVRESTWLMPAMRAARDLRLSSWCIGAGAVRNLVWDALHGYGTPSTLPDIDLVYYDPTDVRPERDAQLRAMLAAKMPDLPWEVTNQAAVHLWYAQAFGLEVAPLMSLEEGVATWPEYATAIGVALRDDDSIAVIAPHGLDDLFALVVRHNPLRASAEMFRERVVSKRLAERWPLVRVIQ